jgi:hypothetical protein
MLLVIECCFIHTDDRHADTSFTHKQPPLRRVILFQPQIKEKSEKSIANAAFDNEPMQTRFIASDHHSRGPEKMYARGRSQV